MNPSDLAQLAVFLLLVVCLVKPVGAYLERVCAHQSTFLDPVLLSVERFTYRLLRVRREREMAGSAIH